MTDIFFKSEAHKARFLQAMQQNQKIDRGKLDTEYAAAYYILTAESGTWNKASGYVDRSGIRFEELLNEVDFSHGYAVLIRLAANLFNEFDEAGKQARPVDLMILDEGNFKVAMTALQLRRRSYSVTDFQ
jgi:hypothetical protein